MRTEGPTCKSDWMAWIASVRGIRASFRSRIMCPRALILWRRASCVAMGVASAMFSSTASAQLSEADIAALQKRGTEEGWTFTVNQNPATAYSLDELCGLVEPKDWQEGARFDPCTPRRALPASYNWCTDVGCPAVRNQGGCGSCWAFGTVGALECSILIQDGIEVNLSEQWLVSCNREGWGCGGGWWAHDYHEWKWDACNGFGAVMEAGFSYLGWDAPCACPYSHEYFIDGWAYIGTAWTVPSVDAIKQAILDYGPVGVGVAVDGAFQAYGGGVFSACSASQINHAVVLVGWDDNQGSGGVWYLRNSWGSGWGEGGYMRIPYGCDYVGFNATYVQYVGNASVKTCELNVLEPPEPQSNAEFGHAVAADEVVAVVGAHQDSCGAGSQCGAAYVYRWSGTSWDEEQKIAASDAAAGDQFGGAVSISGNAALVGAPKDDRGAQANAGSAYVFRYDGGSWIEEQQLTATVAASGAEFGTAVAIEGDVALVGAPKEAGGGAVYVLRYAAGSWDLDATLTAAGAGDGFGTSVSLSGDVAVVGAPSVDCGAGPDCGAAYVYRYSGGSWTEEQKLTASDGQSLDWFGWAVSVDGTQAAVGAPLADCDAGSNCGAVYVFERSGPDWMPMGKVLTQDRAASNYVGWSVAIREGVGLVGAFGLDCRDGTNCGAAYFIRRIEGEWSVDGKLVASDMDDGDSYGSSVALGKHVAMIGAKTRYYPALAAAGGAYAYAFPGDCNDNRAADVCDIRSGYSEDGDGNSRPDECVCVASSPAAPETLSALTRKFDDVFMVAFRQQPFSGAARLGRV